MFKIGIDVGGTFTDFVVLRPNGWCPSIAWMKGRRSDVDRSRVEPGVKVGLPWSTQSPSSSLLPWQACRYHCLGDPAP